MFNLWKDDQIRYWDLAPKLMRNDGEQEMVPFLGAGVSVSDRKEEAPKLDPRFPPAATVDEVAKLLKLEGNARVYLEYAIRMAIRMQAWEQAAGPPLALDELRGKLTDDSYPPFAWELADLFSRLSSYHSLKEKALKALESKELLSKEQRGKPEEVLLPMLKLAAMTTDLGSATDPLASISSYYESTGERKDLWRRLYEVVATKRTPTETHRLIAEAAAMQLGAKYPQDYFIITTNYDCLMEKALDEKGLPYAVLWRNRRDNRIYSRFANMETTEIERLQKGNPPSAPELCVLQKNRSLAVVYKMHGCLYEKLNEQDDGLVITDGDYVEFISLGRDIVPAHVGGPLGAKQLLFLGYSFSDWNVRSVYERAIKRRGEIQKQDYAVTRALSKFEEVYFKNRSIIIVMTDLASFVKGIREQAGKAGRR